jgi:hypothetical protein
VSLYNALFGRNPLSPFYLAILGLDIADVGRFRDCFLQKTDEGEVRIVIYTRNGGGNRDAYEEVTKNLQAHPEYVTDFDDDFDCTYASYVFKVPDKLIDTVKAFAERPDQNVDPGARFKDLLDKMQAGKDDDPTVKHAMEVGKKILEPIIDKLKEQG